MTTPTRHRLVAGLRRFARVAAVGVAALGSLLLVGWALDLTNLRSLLPGAWPLVVVAALVSAAVVWWSAVALDPARHLGETARHHHATRTSSFGGILQQVCEHTLDQIRIGDRLGPVWREIHLIDHVRMRVLIVDRRLFD